MDQFKKKYLPTWYKLRVDEWANLHLLTNPMRRLLISKITFVFERKIYIVHGPL